MERPRCGPTRTTTPLQSAWRNPQKTRQTVCTSTARPARTFTPNQTAHQPAHQPHTKQKLQTPPITTRAATNAPPNPRTAEHPRTTTTHAHVCAHEHPVTSHELCLLISFDHHNTRADNHADWQRWCVRCCQRLVLMGRCATTRARSELGTARDPRKWIRRWCRCCQ